MRGNLCIVVQPRRRRRKGDKNKSCDVAAHIDGRAGGRRWRAGKLPAFKCVMQAPPQCIVNLCRTQVCIDFTSRLAVGEGVLVGSCSNSLVLVHAETLASEYAEARPFRCNAGMHVRSAATPLGARSLGMHCDIPAQCADGVCRSAGPVHAYCLLEGGSTRYLCELEAGDRVLVADGEGQTRALTVGRLKIEPREVMRSGKETQTAKDI